MLAEAGLNFSQIEAITGQSEKMIRYYTKRASGKVLSEEGWGLVKEQQENKNVKFPVKKCETFKNGK